VCINDDIYWLELRDNLYRVGTGCAMDFPALFSLVNFLTARWQHCFAPKLKRKLRAVSRFEVESILLPHLYTKNINSLFSLVIHGTTSAHSILNSFKVKSRELWNKLEFSDRWANKLPKKEHFFLKYATSKSH
jgi:hypothetical protein